MIGEPTGTSKTLYKATGSYRYNGYWNNIPAECRYFYAYPSKMMWVLKALIAAHRGLVQGQASYIIVKKSNIKEVAKEGQ